VCRLARHLPRALRLWTQARKLALLALAPLHVWRILREPDFRRVYPGYAAWLRRLLVIEGLGLAVMLVWAPALFAAALLVLGGSALWLRWRGRPAYGARGGLPPGSLDLLSPATLFDPEYYPAAARTLGAYFKCTEVTRSQVCVSSLATGRQILSEHGESLRPLDLPFHRFIPGGFLRRMEEPHHATYRRLFSAALSPRLVERRQGALCDAAARGLERIARESASAGIAGVSPQPHVESLVFEAWVGVFFGIAPADPEMARLRELFVVSDIRSHRTPRSTILAALASIEAIMRERANGERARPARGEALDTCVLREVVDRQPGALDDPTVTRNLIYMLGTTAADVSALLMWVFKLLSDNPIWVGRLRAEMDDREQRRPPREDGLASRIVAETLRLRQSEFVMREVTRPIWHRGFRIPRGWQLRVCVQASHRDPDVFEQADMFDPDRFLRKRPTRDEYSPFGLDRHACIGEALARAMAEGFARELSRYEWEVTADGPIQLSSWRHWEPSSRFRVRLAPRPSASMRG
jgi:cytochrome P450